MHVAIKSQKLVRKKAEEHRLLKAFMDSVGAVPMLSVDDERTIACRYQRHHRQRDAHALVTANLRFVVKMALAHSGYGVQVSDLVQEGSIGLMHAVSKFDPGRGYRLITYASFWIRARIQACILRDWSIVQTPRRHMRLFSAKARMPNDAQLRFDAVACDDALDDMGMMRHDVSIDTHCRLDDARGDVLAHEHSLVDRFATPTTGADDTLDALRRDASIRRALNNFRRGLDARDRMILERRLLSDEPIGLVELGVAMGVTRQRAHQLEQKLRTRLRVKLAHVGHVSFTA